MIHEPSQLRTVALVAHVDHGKTTLVDAMLRATGTFGEHQAVVDRVMDSGDQERERGITILAKAASVDWRDFRINLVDTPGHADFGGEVERALAMVDGIVLLVDAAEGPLPQTRYVLSKAMAAGLPAVVVLNKVDRADARPDEVLDEIYQLFLDLDADEDAIDFPIVSAISREGRAVTGVGMPGPEDDLTALFEAIVAAVPAPGGDVDAPLQAIVTNLDASEYLGRLAVGRVVNGRLRRGEQVALCVEDEGQPPLRRKLTQLLSFSGIGRLEVDEIAAGDLFIVAGFPEVEIGDTLADPSDPRPLDRLTVDEPVLRMSFGVNTSPFAGKEGKYLTSRHLRERLDREILGNVSIRLAETDSPDVIEVAGRGELQLAVLIETMRREGYELQVSRPEVVVRDIDGARHEPLERAVIDVPDEHVGTVTQALAPRKGRVNDLRPGDTGRTIVTVEAPARGLLGFRSQLLTATRGTALLHQHHAGWTPWVGELPTRKGGAMIADREGVATGYALDNLQQRGELFIQPGERVYEGMIVGENARSDELHVNVVREKQKTNIRTHSADEAIKLVPPREIT
ncbi:MAG: translational GTPase TypA, partial [Acidimicrobiia bacterium]|nr:translational GTPase TypA [Acidimicrobiia bacterium]